MKNLLYSVVLLLVFYPSFSQNELQIIPKPNSVKMGSGHYYISNASSIKYTSEDVRPAVEQFNAMMKTQYGFSLAVKKSKAAINLVKDSKIKGKKGSYNLLVNNKGITIKAAEPQGLFYGLQSLLQMMPASPADNGSLAIPAATIMDEPRFGYRGFMLDVCRHFQPVDSVKKLIDRLAMLKINTLHWHLTEDQGWRIEIKKYPRLTEVGGFRNGTIIGNYPGKGNTNERYGGFYTQEQIKEVVAYAQNRYIDIIPEIEMPGHASAAIAAYPFLSCFPDRETYIPGTPSEKSKAMKGKKVQETWGVFDDIFVPTEQTFSFLEDVLDEVIPLFPAKYIHIGGDEAPKKFWKESAFCQQLIKEKGLKDEHGLQSYFISRMEKYINAKGKQIIGWDEILEGGLAPNATVMSWRGMGGGIEAARHGNNVIMTPTSHCYLDYSQVRNDDSLTIGGYIPLEKSYSLEPVPAELKGTPLEKHILGAQGNLWTEYIPYMSKVEYMIFPRLAAIAEVNWTQAANKDFADFEKRLLPFFSRLDKLNTNYAQTVYELRPALEPAAGGGINWKLNTALPNARITYLAPFSSVFREYSAPLPSISLACGRPCCGTAISNYRN